MKLRLIAEASARDIIEGRGVSRERGNLARADEISREQTAKHLVLISLTKIRNMLEPMGLLKSGSEVGEPIHDPGISDAFNSLRETVKAIASRDAQRIIANKTDAFKFIGQFWGFQIPTNWHDIDVGQAGRATADGWFDEWIRDAKEKSSEAPNGEDGYRLKALALKNLGDEIYKWHQES